MKGNLYKSKATSALYIIETKDNTQGYVRLLCMNFPYVRSSVSIESFKRYYEPIKPKGGKQ